MVLVNKSKSTKILGSILEELDDKVGFTYQDTRTIAEIAAVYSHFNYISLKRNGGKIELGYNPDIHVYKNICDRFIEI